MNRPGQHTFACLDHAVLSIQQAITGRDDQAGAVGIGHRVVVVQKEVDLEHALDLMALHLPVGPPAPSHRWRRRRAYRHPRALWLTAANVQTRSIARATDSWQGGGAPRRCWIGAYASHGAWERRRTGVRDVQMA
jgi:hypothetical protein